MICKACGKVFKPSLISENPNCCVGCNLTEDFSAGMTATDASAPRTAQPAISLTANSTKGEV